MRKIGKHQSYERYTQKLEVHLWVRTKSCQPDVSLVWANWRCGWNHYPSAGFWCCRSLFVYSFPFWAGAVKFVLIFYRILSQGHANKQNTMNGGNPCCTCTPGESWRILGLFASFLPCKGLSNDYYDVGMSDRQCLVPIKLLIGFSPCGYYFECQTTYVTCAPCHFIASIVWKFW